jgi:hypothetical protein
MKTRFLLIALAAASRLTCHAGLPEPDNIVYGEIFIGTNQITAKSTNFVIEARLTTNGPAIASYTMGSLPTAGNFYSLRLSLENSAPSTIVASQPGDSVYVVVRDKTGVRFAQPLTVGSRLGVQRLDFGQAPATTDVNGLPLNWENLFFGRTGLDPGALAANGMTVLQNYIAGTDPNNTNSVLELDIQLNASHQRIISFYGIAAQGTGYTGLTRIYDLQYTTNLGTWFDIPGMNNVLGNNQAVNYLEAGANPSSFYRVKAHLQ